MNGTLTLAMSYVYSDAAPRTGGAAVSRMETTETASLVSALLNRSNDGTVKADPPEGGRMAQCVESLQQVRRRVRVGDGPVDAQARDIDGSTATSAATTLEGPRAYGG